MPQAPARPGWGRSGAGLGEARSAFAPWPVGDGAHDDARVDCNVVKPLAVVGDDADNGFACAAGERTQGPENVPLGFTE